ncbi:hypothetical protein R1flu_007160 [Riccia fluitans]|uniref:Uncharacterized protein n=1 Tax=Riccia fluitans TaxID=41844 RepID=A0ABD1YY39_9MARC
MAARRASFRLLKVLQQSASGQPLVSTAPVFRPAATSAGSCSLPSQVACTGFNAEFSVCRPGSISFRRLYAADGQVVEKHVREMIDLSRVESRYGEVHTDIIGLG